MKKWRLFSRMDIKNQLTLIVLIFVVGLCASMLAAGTILEKVKVNGPIYLDIVQGKDLVADILPPPEYIIESYLVILQSLHENDPAQRSRYQAVFGKLKEDYVARHDFWKKEMNVGKIKELLLVDSYRPSMQFYEIAEKEFFPALLKGDLQTASGLAEGTLKTAYGAHRKVIDEIVTLANGNNEQMEHQARSSLARSRAFLLVFCGIVVLAGILVLSMVGRSIFGVFRKCLEVTENIAAGNVNTNIVVDGKGIVRQLQESLDRMSRNLHDIIGRLASTSGQLSSEAELLHSTSDEMTFTSEAAAAKTDTISTAGEEMAVTSVTIAQNCVRAVEGADKASGSASDGAEAVRKNAAVMERIAEKVRTSAKTVESLGARSEQIGEIVGTIEDIADQTNLLALNAAIEAARAGEQGRGFAVVADEVRALAERTTRATKEIGDMIKTIQNETRDAVVIMVEGVREVENGSTDASRSGEMLQEIFDRINEVTLQVTQIATNAEEQTATSTEISDNINQINDVVQLTARKAHETSRSANSLSRLAGELQEIVCQFRL